MKLLPKIALVVVLLVAGSGGVLPGAHAQQAPAIIGIAANGQTTMEFIGQIDQNGFNLITYGYVTYLGGIESELLFAAGTPAMFRSETGARFTFMATGTANGRSNYQNIFAATTSATFYVYYNETPVGASFDSPDSFASGTLIASFEGRLYSMLNVQEPNVGVLIVHSDTTQTSAVPFTLDGQSYQLGQPNLLARFTLFGQGFRSSTEPLAAYYHIAGDVVSLGLAE